MTVRNHYEASEVIELDKAQDGIRSEKILDVTHDQFSVPHRSLEPIFDDFDE